MAHQGAWGAPAAPPVNPSPALPWGSSANDVQVNIKPEPTRGQSLLGGFFGGSSSSQQPPANAGGGWNQPTPQGYPPQPQPQPHSEAQSHWLLSAAIPFGKVAGIQIRWHVLLPVLLGLQCLVGFSIGPRYGLLMLILFGPVLWATVLIHELGHALTAKRLGVPSEEILIWPLGGLAFIAHCPSAKKDLVIAIAGPLTHVPMAIFWVVCLTLSVESWRVADSGNIVVDPGSFNLWTLLCAGALTMQVVLFLFNLCVPAYPLDGGRVFCDVLCLAGVERTKAGYSSGVLSGLIGGAMVLYGVVMSVRYRTFQTTLLIGAWIAKEAFTVLSMTRKGELARHPMFANYSQ